MFRERTVDDVTKESGRLDSKGVLISNMFIELSPEPLPVVVLIKEN